MKFRILIAALTIASVAFNFGCKKDDFVEVDSVCPEVLATSPANGETSVLISKTITATFNEAMDPASITDASFTVQGGTPVTGTVTFSNRTATFDPNNPLTNNTTYVCRITTAAKDMFGNTLQKDYVWSFSTGATITPIVVATDPVGNSTGVVLNKHITATFNTPMNAATINNTTFTLRQGSTTVAGTVSYANLVATFVPTLPLVPNTTYTATLTTGVQSNSGDALPAAVVWTFTTGTVTAPTVLSTDPAAGAVNVPLNKVISVTFSQAMNQSTIDSNTFVVMNGLAPVSGTVAYSGNTATFTPDINLLSQTTYTATITLGAQTPGGVSLANAYSWDFTTVNLVDASVITLGTASRFGILAATGVSNITGISEIHDLDVGISPGVRADVTGFPPGIILNGTIYASDDVSPPGVAAMLAQGHQDLRTAYQHAEAANFPAPTAVSGDLGGMTLNPGVYKATNSLMIQNGDLTLNAQGNPNAIWIFQIPTTLETIGGSGGSIVLTGGAQAKNVYWQTGSTATLGNTTTFKGNILAFTSIVVNSGTNVEGRLLARNGSVDITFTTITKP